MFMSSSGSLTWRNAWRTASELSTAVVTGTLPPPGEPSDLGYRAPDSAGAPRSRHRLDGRWAVRPECEIAAPASAFREGAGAAPGPHRPPGRRDRLAESDASPRPAPAARS